MGTLTSDAAIDLYTIDIGTTTTEYDWAGLSTWFP